MPSAPTAQPSLVLAKVTPDRSAVVGTGVVGALQVAPPSLVSRIVPSAPTAQPSLVLAKVTARIGAVPAGGARCVQVAPPSVLTAIVPPPITATPASPNVAIPLAFAGDG